MFQTYVNALGAPVMLIQPLEASLKLDPNAKPVEVDLAMLSQRASGSIDDLKAAGLLDPLDEAVFQLQLESEGEED